MKQSISFTHIAATNDAQERREFTTIVVSNGKGLGNATNVKAWKCSYSGVRWMVELRHKNKYLEPYLMKTFRICFNQFCIHDGTVITIALKRKTFVILYTTFRNLESLKTLVQVFFYFSLNANTFLPNSFFFTRLLIKRRQLRILLYK